MEEFGDEAGPAGLVRGAAAAAGVAVEIFVEEDVILEVRVAGLLGMVLQDGALAVRAGEEEFDEPAGQFVGHFVEGEEFPGAGGAFDFEIVPVVVMKFLEGFDDEKVHGQPDGAPPVGVAAEKVVLGFRRPVADFLEKAVAHKPIRFALVPWTGRGCQNRSGIRFHRACG